MNLTSEFEAVPLRFQFDFAWPVSFTKKYYLNLKNANGDMC